MESHARNIFKKKFGNEPEVFSAPGRVNLIGEHTDYNDGFVLPTPLGLCVYAAVRRRGDDLFNVYAFDLDEETRFKLENIERDSKKPWCNYVKGVINSLRDDGHNLSGADIVITGDVPIGSGLASSAALEISIIRALDELNDLGLDPVEMAYIGKRAENEFVGVQSGIMDQFVASLGKYGEALFIDCRHNSYSSIPFFDDYTIVIADTLKKRELASSAYNERKSECQKAVSIMKEFYPDIKTLRDVNIEMLKDRWEALPKVVASRAKHVVTENRRVLESVEFLKRDDVYEFGKLMYNRHESLRYDYQVSCLELDTLVEATMDMDYVIGERITGAGFGGCTVNIVEDGKVETFKSDIKQKYEDALGKNLKIYLV